MDLLKGLVDDKILRILKVFLSNPNKFYHISLVSEEANVPLATTFRILQRLHQNNLVDQKSVSKFKIYSLKKSNKTRKITKLIR